MAEKEYTAKVDKIGRIVIPQAIREILNIEADDYVTVRVTDVAKR